MIKDSIQGSEMKSKTGRIKSLDQFRGYTVLGMLFVNFMSRFSALPQFFQHHNTYFSYADSIMPQFLFAVGMAYRLTFLRAIEKTGYWATVGKVIRRNTGLILLGAVIYLDGKAPNWEEFTRSGFAGAFGKGFLRELFQTLVHIGVTAIWILPVIGASSRIRILYGLSSAILHLALSYFFYFRWVISDPKGIDGGALGFLTWSIPMLAGTIAWDLMARMESGSIKKMLGYGVLLMSIAWLISCLVVPPREDVINGKSASSLTVRISEPPLVKPGPEMGDGNPISILQMSQRTGNFTYPLFGAGFSLAVYAFFIFLCEGGSGWNLGIFRTLGNNALAAYILHGMVGTALFQFSPKDAPIWFGLLLFGVYLGIIYLFMRHLEKHGLFLRL